MPDSVTLDREHLAVLDFSYQVSLLALVQRTLEMGSAYNDDGLQFVFREAKKMVVVRLDGVNAPIVGADTEFIAAWDDVVLSLPCLFQGLEEAVVKKNL